MFLVSNSEKKYFYKISDIKSGTTKKGEPYTFISISNKKRDTGDYENAKLMYWDNAPNMEKGDYVAFHNVSGVEHYSFQPTGSLKTYLGVNISTTKIEVKKAEKTEETTTPATQPTQSTPAPTPANEILQPIADDDLPF